MLELYASKNCKELKLLYLLVNVSISLIRMKTSFFTYSPPATIFVSMTVGIKKPARLGLECSMNPLTRLQKDM